MVFIKKTIKQLAIMKGTNEIMRKYKLLICMLLMAVVVTACGNKDAESPSDVPTSEDVADKDDEETEEDEKLDSTEDQSSEDPASEEDPDEADIFANLEPMAEINNPYVGHTVQDMFDEGFEATGSMSYISGSSGSISVFLNREIEQLTVTVEVDDKIYEEYSALDSTDSKGEYFAEQFGDVTLTYINCRIDYLIYNSGDLQTAVEMGIYEPFEDAQGKTIGALLEDGYKYINESYIMTNDCMVTMSNENGEYIMLIDLSEKDEELNLFWGDGEELLQDYTVVEGYMLKVS